jgi:hypothetical protein
MGDGTSVEHVMNIVSGVCCLGYLARLGGEDGKGLSQSLLGPAGSCVSSRRFRCK